MNLRYIVTIDQSTSGTKAILFDQSARLIHRETITHKQYYPKPGWVEHDPEEIYRNTIAACRKLLDHTKINKGEIAFISISNQRETVLAWDKETGKPLGKAVVWQCLRGEEKCNEIKKAGNEDMIRKKTGLIIDPYFSASGLHWIMQNHPDAKKLSEKGRLAAGTIDSWLVYKLTGGKAHATDYSNASRTMLFNIHQLQWDEEICNLFDVPTDILPSVKFADDIFGQTNLDGLLDESIPICGILGDSHAALFGQQCFHKGLSKVTYGTGSSVMMNIGEKAAEPPQGLVTSIGYGIKEKIDYVLEGNIHSTGATLKWLTDQLQLISSPAESEQLAASVDSTEGVYFVPAFAGLGAPYWDNQVRASITGITAGSGKAHIVRAAVESIAYQIKDLIDLMAVKAEIMPDEIRVDGGPTRNNFLMQFQSDMLNSPVAISDIEEISALGTALAGGLGTGWWKNRDQLKDLYTDRKLIHPKMSADKRNVFYSGWKKAVEMARGK